MTDFSCPVPRTPSTAETIAMVDAEWCARLQKAGDEVTRLKLREAELLEANNRYLQRARDAEARVTELERGIFTIGNMTMEKVFRRNGITNLHNLQRVLDAVEAALISEAGSDSDDVANLKRALADADAATIAMEARAIAAEAKLVDRSGTDKQDRADLLAAVARIRAAINAERNLHDEMPANAADGEIISAARAFIDLAYDETVEDLVEFVDGLKGAS